MDEVWTIIHPPSKTGPRRFHRCHVSHQTRRTGRELDLPSIEQNHVSYCLRFRGIGDCRILRPRGDESPEPS